MQGVAEIACFIEATGVLEMQDTTTLAASA
jgi:hypothetical protein